MGALGINGLEGQGEKLPVNLPDTADLRGFGGEGVENCAQNAAGEGSEWKTGEGLQEALRKMPVRAEHVQIVIDARREIEQLRRQLATAVKERDSWKSTCDMYAKAWTRELGNRLFRKSHEIDALVLTTRHVYRWYRHGVSHHGFSESRDDPLPEIKDGPSPAVTALCEIRRVCERSAFGAWRHRIAALVDRGLAA